MFSNRAVNRMKRDNVLYREEKEHAFFASLENIHYLVSYGLKMLQVWLGISSRQC